MNSYLQKGNVMLKKMCLMIGLVLTASTGFAQVHLLYHCHGQNVTPDYQFKVTLHLKKIAPHEYHVNWGQPKNTAKAFKNIDNTLWFIYGNSGIASFHGKTPATGKFYAGSSQLIFGKNSLETIFYGYELMPQGKVSYSIGHIHCIAA